MYEINGICYAGTPENEIRIQSVKPLKAGIMLVLFQSGEKKLFDTTLLSGPVFEDLKNEEVFCNPKVEHGFISWANGTIDIAPEYIYEYGTVYTEDCDGLLVG